MNVSRHVRELIGARLQDRSVVVWYDPEGAYRELFDGYDISPIVKIDASRSVLEARHVADAAWRRLTDPDPMGEGPIPMLIYVPAARGTDEESRRQDPFEPFALAGAAFGAVDAERLASVARQVLVGREAEVDRLFAEGAPTVGQLDALAGGTRYPLLKEALGTDVPARVAAMLICRSHELGPQVAATPGLAEELQRLASDAFGLPGKNSVAFEALAPSFAQWVFFSEFAFDLPGALPQNVAHVPRAGEPHRRAIYELCADLRSSAEHADRYREVAEEVERRLGLSPLASTADAFGERDTFPFEDSAALLCLQEKALAGDEAGARAVSDRRRHSVWRAVPERGQLWRLAERCLDLLAAGKAWETRAVNAERPTADHVRAYCSAEDGLWRVDQAQRLVEQAAALPVVGDRLARLLDHVRGAYRRWLGNAQGAFAEAVGREGWPPEGLVRQTQAWSRHGAGPVRDGRKTAWFLVDALRFEMGRDLAERLAAEGTAKVEPACGVVPAATAFGMAALLPGAEAGLTFERRGDSLVPCLAGRPVVTADERREVFRTAFGDRTESIRLGELLTSSTAQLRSRIGGADVLSVFSTEIDDFGERSDPLMARRYIGDVVADLLAAANRLALLGFERMVFAADHGFIQLPEVLPGDRCPEPAGRWLLQKRRALLGTAGGRPPSVVVFQAANLGLQGPVQHVCVPRGVKVFRAGSPYFHEGVSLQECVVPLVVLDATRRRSVSADQPVVEVHYRADRFTTRIFSVQVSYSSLVSTELAVRVQAFVPGTREIVGEAADCEARDPHTGIVTLSTTERVHVPIALDPDFSGPAVEVRVSDATTPGKSYAERVLKSAILE